MGHVQDNAEESRRVITRLKDGGFTLPLDNGAQISVAIRVDAAARRAAIDFTGTSRMASAEAGEAGRNSVGRADGSVERLDHIGSAQMRPGDVFVIETPGSGGFGVPPIDPAQPPDRRQE